jgi:copper(I)-binding protein
MQRRHCLLLAAAALTLLPTAHAQPAVDIQGAWVRASVPGQSGTGAFMKITSRTGARLVGAASPVAGVAEVHEMRMDGDVMRMRAIAGLDLPAGTAVELKPGGMHVMLMDLKSALAKGSTVPLTLTFADAKGAQSRLELQVPVAATAPGAAGSPGGHGGHGGHGVHKH